MRGQYLNSGTAAPADRAPSGAAPWMPSPRLGGTSMSRIVLFGVLLLGAGLLAGCGDAPSGASAPPPPAVTVSRPLQKKITEWDEYTGRFTAVETVEVRARVSGFIDSMHFKDG